MKHHSKCSCEACTELGGYATNQDNTSRITSRKQARKSGSTLGRAEHSLADISDDTVRLMGRSLLKWTVSSAKRLGVPRRWREVWARECLRSAKRDAKRAIA